MTKHLQSMNEEFYNTTSANDQDECAFFIDSIISSIVGVTYGSTQGVLNRKGPILLDLEIKPYRCQEKSITDWICTLEANSSSWKELCAFWTETNSSMTISDLASKANIRAGAIEKIVERNDVSGTSFEVIATFNQSCAICSA